MILKNLQVSTITYTGRLNINIDLDSLYHIFSERIDKDIYHLKYKDSMILTSKNEKYAKKCQRLSKFNFKNCLEIHFINCGCMRIFNNGTILLIIGRNLNLPQQFLNIINEYLSLSVFNVYNLIKYTIPNDICNNIMKELSTIKFDEISTAMIVFSAKTNLITNYDDLGSKILQLFFPVTYVYSPLRHLIKHKDMNILIFKTSNVLICTKTFSKLEECLALLRQL